MAGSFENMELTDDDFKMKIPCGAMVAGPSKSGKSTFLMKLVRNAAHVFKPAPQSILYAYGIYDARVHLFQRLGAKLINTLPTDEMLESLQKPALVIIDDLMSAATDKYLQELYTKKAHHMNLAVFFVTQYLFTKEARVARMNSDYLFIMRSPSSALHIRTIGQQLFPGRLKYFTSAYDQATDVPYKYLMIDVHPASHLAFRLRGNIFPGEERLIFADKGG